MSPFLIPLILVVLCIVALLLYKFVAAVPQQTPSKPPPPPPPPHSGPGPGPGPSSPWTKLNDTYIDLGSTVYLTDLKKTNAAGSKYDYNVDFPSTSDASTLVSKVQAMQATGACEILGKVEVHAWLNNDQNLSRGRPTPLDYPHAVANLTVHYTDGSQETLGTTTHTKIPFVTSSWQPEDDGAPGGPIFFYNVAKQPNYMFFGQLPVRILLNDSSKRFAKLTCSVTFDAPKFNVKETPNAYIRASLQPRLTKTLVSA